MKKTRKVFSASQKKPNRLTSVAGQLAVNGVGNGACQPPKNRIAVMAQISTMLAYSPIWNSR